MPYEDDYKMWLEKSLIEMNPDWVCDGMADKEFTHKWCEENCGKDNAYIMPKCLHMYYHHIARADHKTENSSEKPNNCEHITEDGVTCAKYPACDDCLDNPLNKVKGSKRLLKGKDEPTGYNLSPVDKDINVRSKTEPKLSEIPTSKCRYEPKDEPQTDTEIAKAIVHKMIDDAVIAEDAYPDLRQKMHNAVDEYEPQTDCPWK